MIQVKEPKTEALRRLRDILQGQITECQDAMGEKIRAVRRGEVFEGQAGLARFYEGKTEAFQSALSLLEHLGPQIEAEAHRLGYEVGQDAGYDRGFQLSQEGRRSADR